MITPRFLRAVRISALGAAKNRDGQGKFTGEVTLPELLLWFSFRLCTVFFFGAVQNLSIFLSAEYGMESRKCSADRLYERQHHDAIDSIDDR